MERTTRDELIRRIRADRERFDEIVARVPADRLVDPLLPGGWSVKDVLAHIAWGDRESIGVAQSRELSGSELWAVSEDERNEAVVRASRSLSLEEVTAEYRDSYERYVAALTELSDEDLNEPDRIAGLAERIPGWRPWRVLYDPDHYEEHGRAIEAVLEPGDGERPVE